MASVYNIADTPVDQRLEHIRDSLRRSDQCDTSQPGNSNLLSLLDNYLAPKTAQDHIDFLRGVLQVYRESPIDTAYQDFIKTKLTDDECNRLEQFVDGSKAASAGKSFQIPHSIGVREELEALHHVNRAIISQTTPIFRKHSTANGHLELNGSATSHHGFTGFVHKLASFLFDNKHQDEIKVWDNVEFKNWGQTLSYTPRYTVFPRSVASIVHIVKFAVQENLAIRCSGYRHSWSPVFGENGQILLSMMDPDKVSRLPDTTSLPLWGNTPPTELESINVVQDAQIQCGPGKTLVRLGAACTNERLRRWCIENNKLTIPLNVIMVEITLGGSNALMCHGAGRQHRTLSDLVRCIEYVDCHGVLQTISDASQLKAASGAFGLLGIVTHITMEFVPMSYANLAPKKLPVAVAIPPPDGYETRIPPALQVTRTAAQRQEDIAAFEKACDTDYYAEWFWFPYSDEAWVNTWSNTSDSSDVVDFPSAPTIFVQWAGTVLMNISQYSKVLDTIGSLIGVDFTGTTIISRAAMWMLGEQEVRTYLTDGLHFQRAIQNVRVRDMEVEIAIPQKDSSSKADLAIARRAWWDAILIAYEHSDTQPQRMPLEMRIMGDSDMIMSPQRGNKLGTCSIEVLTLESQRDDWMAYSQQILDKWMSYNDASGKALKARPHWAKEWVGHTVRGRPWKDVLKEECQEEIREFRGTLEKIGKQQGWSIEELQERFGNKLLNELMFGASE